MEGILCKIQQGHGVWEIGLCSGEKMNARTDIRMALNCSEEGLSASITSTNNSCSSYFMLSIHAISIFGTTVHVAEQFRQPCTILCKAQYRDP